MGTSDIPQKIAAARRATREAVSHSYGDNTGLAVRRLADGLEQLSTAVELINREVRDVGVGAQGG